jgi:ribitol-5-phosphate 2-dehydrogenase
MINQSYRLVSPKQIRIDFVDENIDSEYLLVRPTYLSICAADQRYYTGSRGKEVMDKKLPMALIHEAVGIVLYDPSGELKKGTNVVMIPNTPHEYSSIIKENYLTTSSFRASGMDGFMQSFVKIKKDRVIPFYKAKPEVAVLLELLSVAMNALEHFDKYSHLQKQTIGIWGCGNVGFVTALVLKKTFPNAKIIVFGTTEQKLNYFSFADETYLINNIPPDLRIDHAFECVGGMGSESAINQIIDYINPMGSIALMGVSENNVAINTRMVLEKGLTLLGNSRSGREDFERSIQFIEENEDVRNYLRSIISEEIVVRTVSDMHKAFENDLTNEFKTVMKWEI